MVGSSKAPNERRRKSRGGMKSASKIAMNGESVRVIPCASAPALNPWRELRLTCPPLIPRRGTWADDRDGVVVRVVKDLHLEPIVRPVQLAHRVENAFGYVALVVDRHLDADLRLGVTRH